MGLSGCLTRRLSFAESTADAPRRLTDDTRASPRYMAPKSPSSVPPRSACSEADFGALGVCRALTPDAPRPIPGPIEIVGTISVPPAGETSGQPVRKFIPSPSAMPRKGHRKFHYFTDMSAMHATFYTISTRLCRNPLQAEQYPCTLPLDRDAAGVNRPGPRSSGKREPRMMRRLIGTVLSALAAAVGVRGGG